MCACTVYMLNYKLANMCCIAYLEMLFSMLHCILAYILHCILACMLSIVGNAVFYAALHTCIVHLHTDVCCIANLQMHFSVCAALLVEVLPNFPPESRNIPGLVHLLRATCSSAQI